MERHVFLDLETVACPDIAYSPKSDKDFPPPFAHKIVCAGLLIAGGGEFKTYALTGDEATILTQVFGFVTEPNHKLITFNGRGFDLPVLVCRGLKHGLSWPWLYAGGYRTDPLYRYSRDRHWDISDDIALFGATRSPRLDHAARAVGLPGKIGGETGSSVQAMYDAGRIDDIARYCLEDVLQTAIVSYHMRVFRGALDGEIAKKIIEAVMSLPAAERLRNPPPKTPPSVVDHLYDGIRSAMESDLGIGASRNARLFTEAYEIARALGGIVPSFLKDQEPDACFRFRLLDRVAEIFVADDDVSSHWMLYLNGEPVRTGNKIEDRIPAAKAWLGGEDVTLGEPVE